MKYKNFIVTFGMAAVIFGLAGLAWFGDGKAYSFSERRELKQRPELNLDTVLDGTFMEDFEAYALDQFPFRDQFRRLKAEIAFNVLGQKDNNGVYVADGHASKVEYPLNEPMLEYAADKFRYIYETYLQDAEHIYFSIVPDKNYYLAEENGYLSLDYGELIDSMREKTEYMTYIDLTEHLSLDDYYCTDTHWRQENLVDVADMLLEEMGSRNAMEKAEQEKKYTVHETDIPFYGVYSGQAALPLEPDVIKYLTNDELEECKITCYDTGEPVEIPMYDMERVSGKDPYEMFLSGTCAVLTVENPQAENGRELIVFRDSFGSSLIPLLAEGYEKITVLDIRYVNSSILGQFVNFGTQDVLFLYSTLLLNSSLGLK